jgi:hypothetical protein
MKKLIIIMFLIFLMSLSSLVTAEIVKEGSGDYLLGQTSTFEVIRMGEGRLQINWNKTGVITSAPEGSPFLYASFHLIGTLHSNSGNFKSSGGGVFTRPNGDRFFGIVEIEGSLVRGATGGRIRIIDGTGECTGMVGEMTPTTRPTVISSKQGTYQGIGVGKISWKIP